MSKKTKQAAQERQAAYAGGVVITVRPKKKPVPGAK
jgi:hypothetical protein